MRAYPLIALIVFFAIFAASAAPPAAETAKEKQIETSIESATVYSGIAQVTRTGRIDVTQGIIRITCEDLPAGFNESSLQVEGSGTARATVLGVDIVELPGEVSETPKYKELKDRLESLEIERDSLQITLQSLNKRQEFITHLGSQPFKERKDQEQPDIFRVQDWKNLMDFLDEERILVERGLYHIGTKSKKIMEKIEWIRAELNTMRANAQWKKVVAIDCEVASAGHLDFDLSYIVEGAAWTPEYTIRYAAADDLAGLVYNARIRQVTGEDWKDVSIILSTARPQIGAAPPKLTPYYIVMLQRALGSGYDKKSKLEEEPDAIALRSEALVKTGDELHVRGELRRRRRWGNQSSS